MGRVDKVNFYLDLRQTLIKMCIGLMCFCVSASNVACVSLFVIVDLDKFK